MSILITGGAGYIGSHTMVEFLNAGKELVCVDNLCNSKKTSLERVKQITGKEVKFYKIDLLDYDALENVFKENNIEIAVLTIPKASAITVAEKLVDCNIKAIWNFAHVDLVVPEGVQVENVHLSDSLMKLSYNSSRYWEMKNGE